MTVQVFSSVENSPPRSVEEKRVLAAVTVAWPTLALAAAGVTSFLVVPALTLRGQLGWGWAVLLQSVAIFACFTPMHDAVHHSVSRIRWVNELVGWVAGIPQLTPFLAFRYVHLEHHKHTNEPGADPDFWAGSGPRWQWPLRWLTTDLHYYPWCLLRARRLPRYLWVMTGVTLLYWSGLVLLAWSGYAREVLLLWVLPTRLATALLGFAFDFLPHRPHTVPARQNRFVASYVVEHGFLTPLLLGQNYHLIHHLYPAVPFYRYGQVWRALRARLVASGARVIRLW